MTYKKQVRFDPENLERLSNKGTSGDDADSAFKKLLDQDDDIDRILLGEEPQTDRLKLVVKKFTKDKEVLNKKLKECEEKKEAEK